MTGLDACAAGMTADELKRSLIRLESWPDLSFVSEASQVRVARICGLLSRKPTVGHLIPKVLGESDAVVLAEVLRLTQMGHLYVVGKSAASEQASAYAPLQVGGTTELTPAPPVKQSLVAKLWAKLGL